MHQHKADLQTVAVQLAAVHVGQRVLRITGAVEAHVRPALGQAHAGVARQLHFAYASVAPEDLPQVVLLDVAGQVLDVQHGVHARGHGRGGGAAAGARSPPAAPATVTTAIIAIAVAPEPVATTSSTAPLVAAAPSSSSSSSAAAAAAIKLDCNARGIKMGQHHKGYI